MMRKMTRRTLEGIPFERERKKRKPSNATLVTRPDVGSSRTPNHSTPETLRLTAPTPNPMLGMSGLMNLLTWVEHRQLAQASPHEEGGVPCPVPHPTRLQYGLVGRAQALGWAADRVLVIDDDLGKWGTTVHGRVGFQRLVSEVSLDHVGIIFGVEMSRLAR
jgi:hypothetical protein